jgi:hypothetical protein
MKSVKALFAAPILSVATCAVLLTSPVTASAEASGSDFAFNQMVMEMAGSDTGSMWFDYYVETLNQEIAARDTLEPYGAAGPNGPVSGFDGYMASFIPPDTGSMWFNSYVDNVNRLLREKEQRS